MMKKALYLILITFILIVPIILWLDMKWAINPSSINIRKLRFAFTRDTFLFFATISNSLLYGFGVYKIINMKEDKKASVSASNISVKTEEKVNIIPSASMGNGVINPNDKKWQEMYKGDGKPLDSKANETVKTDVKVTSERPKKTEEAPLPKTSEQPLNKTEEKEEKNIINIPVSSNEVYITQAERILSEMGYETMGDVFINGVNIDFMAIAGSDTLLIGKVQSSNNEIVANENTSTPNNPPSWFSNNERFNSPVWEIKNARDEISKMINEVLPADNGVMVKPVVIIPNANIINLSDMMDTWHNMGVDVAKFNGEASLPEFASIIENKNGVEVLESYKKFVETLIKYFSQKYKRKSLKKAG